ncbi:MAG: hypothetical protein M0R46_04460 [Candidatus Muirbacterium halophilum]|nr:hypothetical protein [Candidatus Muirbacterium halophilum]MCK9475147.1 hypothetical protein [Candidatus Muirbacterium halophilum]
MRRLFFIIISFIILFSVNAFESGVPGWVHEYFKGFEKSGFISQKSEYNIYAMNSRVLVAREIFELLKLFSSKPQNFSTEETRKLGQLAGEFADELKFLNLVNLEEYTILLKLLKNKIETNRSVVMTSKFHTLGKNGEVQNSSRIVHQNVVKAEIFTDRAVKHFYNKNYSKALLDLEQAVNKFPNFLTAHFWLGRVYVKKGEYYKAIHAWEKVVNSLGNRIYINDFVEVTSDYNEVFMEILEVLSVYPDNKVANNLLKTLQENLRSK